METHQRTFRWVSHALCVAGLVFCGCSADAPSTPSVKTHPVQGKVAFANGQPFGEGIIQFQPVAGSGGGSQGEIKADGRFELTTVQENGQTSPGAIAGKYRVLVMPRMTEAQSEVPIELAGEFTIEEKDNEFSLVVPNSPAR